MSRCLSDEALVECYGREGGPDAVAHLKNCLSCAGRYKALQGDMAVISQALEMAPPRRRAVTVGGLVGWRIAVSALALVAAFTIGWSLRAISPTPPEQIASRESVPAAPLQLSRQDDGTSPAVYAEYVQGAFEGDTCTDPDDPLGCP